MTVETIQYALGMFGSQQYAVFRCTIFQLNAIRRIRVTIVEAEFQCAIGIGRQIG